MSRIIPSIIRRKEKRVQIGLFFLRILEKTVLLICIIDIQHASAFGIVPILDLRPIQVTIIISVRIKNVSAIYRLIGIAQAILICIGRRDISI